MEGTAAATELRRRRKVAGKRRVSRGVSGLFDGGRRRRSVGKARRRHGGDGRRRLGAVRRPEVARRRSRGGGVGRRRGERKWEKIRVRFRISLGLRRVISQGQFRKYDLTRLRLESKIITIAY